MLTPVLGVIGGGQLGMFFLQAAQRLGFSTLLLDPKADCPAAIYANQQLRAEYDDIDSLKAMLRQVSAVTVEFEHLPEKTLQFLKRTEKIYPSGQILYLFSQRIREKNWLKQNGFPVARYLPIEKTQDFQEAVHFPFPARLKTAFAGYDGKGQQFCRDWQEAYNLWQQWQQPLAVLEQEIVLDKEISVLAASNGLETRLYPVAENLHRQGILEESRIPARIPEALLEEARRLTLRLVDELHYKGLLTIEFFITQDKLLINEIAPRTHNSGHFSLDACLCSQFEQQVRILAGLPLGDSSLLFPVRMRNFLGLDEVAFQQVLRQEPHAKYYWYRKHQARPGRKMGHSVTRL